ncbi:MAG: helix-turn-helix transcriptional regulator, partial [Rhodobacter sp.]|nr:helix-turn-helix transcriptional regulator [Rhodobacter sp.]
RLPYVVRGAPVRADRIDRKGGLLALLLVLDPDDEGRVTARGLGALGILTRTELEVCELLVRGFSLTEIAQIRDKSPETIKDRSKSVIAKLVCRSRLDLVRLALATNPPLRDFTGDPPAGG